MDHFNYHNGELFAENIAVANIAKQYGTPCYIYSKATFERHWRVINDALKDYPHMICYAVKANSNIAILNLLAKLGSGFDVVSGGELERVIIAGGDPTKIVFSGVGKTETEMQRALELGIHCFNVESQAELEKLASVAKKAGKSAPISIRINPNIDAKTHPYISTGLKDNKFGIEFKQAISVYQKAKQLDSLDIIGIDCHIGSQITELSPFIEALKCLLTLIEELKALNIHITHINLGGGLGVTYTNESPPSPAEHAKALLPLLKNSKLTLILEPGRAIAANAGILITKILYLKHSKQHNFAIVDAGMNDYIRPALYNSKQAIIPVIKAEDSQNDLSYDIVGPVCESADFFAKNQPMLLKENELLAIRSTGAYGFCMSSNYNTRPRCPELLVDDDNVYIIRQRETIEDLLAKELIPMEEK